MIPLPPPQIEIIQCLQQEQDMADEKDKTTPIERCEPVKPKPGEVTPQSGGGGTGSNPPSPPKPPSN